VEKPETLAWRTLLDLVRSYNAFVLHLVSNLDQACLGNVWIVGDEERSLEFLARDHEVAPAAAVFDHGRVSRMP